MYVIVYVLFFYLYKYIYSVCVCVNSWCYRDTTLGITKKPVAEPSFASGEGCGLYDMLLLDFLNSLRLHLWHVLAHAHEKEYVVSQDCVGVGL